MNRLGTRAGRKREAELYARALKVMPGGVASNFRDWGDDTRVMGHARGSHIWDADGNEYIDYRLGFGPIILGHAYPAVNERVKEAIDGGTVFAFTTPWEIRVAERIARMCPGVDMVRFANSGTEATLHALRIARAHTGRDRVIKFEGHYHGMHDYLLWSTASANPTQLGDRRAPKPYCQSPGIPRAVNDLVITLPFNDRERLEETMHGVGEEIAAIIVEPVMGNSASIEPQPGWLEAIRACCDQYGAVMVMDEVKTGFRIAPGGAQQVYGVLADLTTYAKALGNGFPVAAIGGRREIMEGIGYGKTAHGGTYCGNVVAMAAAEATLDILEDGTVLETIAQRGRRLMNGVSDILSRASIPHRLSGPPAMFGLLLTDEPIEDFRGYAHTNHELYERLAMALVERGVIPDPDAREPWFLCYQHEEEDIDATLEILEDAVRHVTASSPPSLEELPPDFEV